MTEQDLVLLGQVDSRPRANARRARRLRGQSLVELSISLPLLLLILLGTIDLGRMFFDYVEMRNAAREGAAYGARNPTDDAGIRARVTAHGVPADTAIAVSCVDGSCTELDGTGRIVVTTSRTFTPVTTSFLQTWFGLGPVTLTATASMRAMT